VEKGSNRPFVVIRTNLEHIRANVKIFWQTWKWRPFFTLFFWDHSKNLPLRERTGRF